MWGINYLLMEIWTITKLLDWTTAYFKKNNIEWPHLEAEILLAHSLDLKRIELYINHERILTEGELKQFKQLILRRSQREPIAYITGNQPFLSLPIYVNRSVLIPRPETEQLVETAIGIVKSARAALTSGQTAEWLIADIGTGSGAIAITLAKHLTAIKVVGIDSSAEAVKTAQKNAEHHKVESICQFIVGDLFEPLKEKFDLILSNPPYIPTSEIDKLDPDVKDWEPRGALDGGEDGLDYINKLIQDSPKHLKGTGSLILEFGMGQARKIRELSANHFKEVKIINDLAGKERIFIGQV
jgi:release factor glutamine methyltransferase